MGIFAKAVKGITGAYKKAGGKLFGEIGESRIADKALRKKHNMFKRKAEKTMSGLSDSVDDMYSSQNELFSMNKSMGQDVGDLQNIRGNLKAKKDMFLGESLENSREAKELARAVESGTKDVISKPRQMIPSRMEQNMAEGRISIKRNTTAVEPDDLRQLRNDSVSVKPGDNSWDGRNKGIKQLSNDELIKRRGNLGLTKGEDGKLNMSSKDKISGDKSWWDNQVDKGIPQAVGGTIGLAYLVSSMSDKRGQQSNAELYGQRTPYR